MTTTPKQGTCSWWVKARRAQSDQDFETWKRGGVMPTLNDFDNASDSRATVLIAFSHTQGLDAQPSEDATPTLRKNGGGQSVTDEIGVRRLTPVECERLQGFPDDWTKYRLNEKGELVEQADSPRYKQMGNAVAVPVVEWIVNRLVNNQPKEQA